MRCGEYVPVLSQMAKQREARRELKELLVSAWLNLCDELRKANGAHGDARHVLVLRREHFWAVPVCVDAGAGAGAGALQPLSVAALARSLQFVRDESDRLTALAAGTSASAGGGTGSRVAPATGAGPSSSLAILTTLDRDTWADARAALEAHSCRK